MTKGNQPLVSVIMAAHNSKEYIAEAIESVLSQTYPNWELIVSDNSTDETRDIITQYVEKDPRIKLFTLDAPIRQTVARIKAIEISSGKYIAVLDSDDISLPRRLEMEVNFLEAHPNVVVVGSGADLIDETGVVIGKKQKATNYTEICFKLLLQTQFIHSSICMQRDAYMAIGGYDAVNHERGAEDYELWNRFVNHGYWLTNLPDILVRYRTHLRSLSVGDVSGVPSERAFHVNEQNIKRYLPRITRPQIELLSKLVNRPRLTLRETMSVLPLYRELAYAYIIKHHLEGDSKKLIVRIYNERKWHALRTLLKNLAHII